MAETKTKSKKPTGAAGASTAASKAPKRKIAKGIVFIESTFNNTKILFTDEKGRVILWTTSAAQGFTSAKKSTPYAAAKVADVISEKMKIMGVKDIDIVVKGVGSGREAGLRAFVNYGFTVHSIKDKTPIPHNGPRRKKPRRI